ncbi:MAG: helix-turn-helix domain-containing protein [Pseudomonadota bacterium]
MANDTRERFLDTAEALFAERGFYGVSIAAIAAELGLTKQALLHHFSSKEKIYGDVLRRISARFEAIAPDTDRDTERDTNRDTERQAEAAGRDPAKHLVDFFAALYAESLEHPDQIRLLMRELLDNKRRADAVGTWYLKPFLERLIEMLKAVSNWRDADEACALVAVYQILGAINYYVLSDTTLVGIFGEDLKSELDRAFPEQLQRLIDAVMETHG